MRNSVSKLTLLFITAILIPGSVLTYFSIQNISSQQDLTEKQLLEEQAHIGRYLTDRFHEMVQNQALSFYADLDGLRTIAPESMTHLDTMKAVEYSFIISREGHFIRPNYYDGSVSINKRIHYSDRFQRSYTAAQAAEFEYTDFSKAAELYGTSLEGARDVYEQASAVNGLARVSAKRGYYSESMRHYGTLVEDYGSIVDETGYPFSYYALHQLTQFYPRISVARLLPKIDGILHRISAGHIPITEQTVYLIHNAETWYLSLPDEVTTGEDGISEHLSVIHKSIRFVSEAGRIIKQYVDNNQLRTATKLGRFSWIPGSIDDQPILIVLRDRVSDSNIAGFTVDLDYIRKELIRAGEDHLHDSDIGFTVVNTAQPLPEDTADSGSIQELSSLVPLWRVWLRPKNPEAISQYVTKRRWIYGIFILFLSLGMILGIALVVRDMSREQKLAQLRNDFVSNVTHELKTPLTSIRMFAETMLMDRVKNKRDQREYLSVIVNESDKLTRLINTVLDSSKIEQEEQQYHMHSVNFSTVVEKAVDAVAYWLKENGFAVVVDIEEDITIRGDEDALEQTMNNLLSNAMKFSHDRKEITVRLCKKDGSIRVEVQDRGLGIPESKQPRIFEKYYRAHSGHTADKGGSGLGLAVVKHIVDAHEGTIELKSKVNEGTTFTIVFPQVEPGG
ncbi:MAG: HAMP domain-containing histidine kinase [Candidatus Zixiibacteriota bacterium]|nr:MAG: HAMP domain-containing histidine kinase [candidate division Zixibacteria bacterium]